MTAIKKYHINPKTGEVGVCNSRLGRCPFGTPLMHFYSEDEARGAANRTLQRFYEFTSKSLIPQDPNWFTVHIFEPGPRMNFTGPLRRTEPGHHLVIENGWILEKVDEPRKWQLLGSALPQFPSPSPGLIFSHDAFYYDLSTRGGRIESAEGLPHFHIEWD